MFDRLSMMNVVMPREVGKPIMVVNFVVLPTIIQNITEIAAGKKERNIIRNENENCRKRNLRPKGQ